MSTSLGYDDPCDRVTTLDTGLSRPSINKQPFLMSSSFSIAVNVISERCPSKVHTFRQHSRNHLEDPQSFILTERIGPPQRMYATHKKSLVSINIAKPGNEGLIEQKGLGRDLSPLHSLKYFMLL